LQRALNIDQCVDLVEDFVNIGEYDPDLGITRWDQLPMLSPWAYQPADDGFNVPTSMNRNVQGAEARRNLIRVAGLLRLENIFT
jgi:hypothetical protein